MARVDATRGGSRESQPRARQTAARPARGAAPVARSRLPAPARPAAPAVPARPRRRGNGRLAALLCALVLVATLAYLLSATTFSVRRVAISGAVATSAQEVLAASGVIGYNVFTVDPQFVAERLAALPTVKSAQVWLALPDRLVVQLVERQAALVWQVSGERFLVDADGFVIAANPPDDRTRGLLIVQARDGEAPAVGSRVDATIVRAAGIVTRRLAQDLPIPLNGLEYTARTGLVLLGDGGWRIVFGNDDRLEEKLAVAIALLNGERTWTSLDVTDPDRPFSSNK